MTRRERELRKGREKGHRAAARRWPAGVERRRQRPTGVSRRGEACGELGSLGAEDGVLGVDGEEALGGEAERSGDVHILAVEVCHLRGEVVEVALLPHEEAIKNQPIDGEVDSHGVAAGRSQPNRSRHPAMPAAAHILPMHAP
uniref:Uncharacterized protein n=1 Tax=Oryza nivara TaxID=4536 RepID=A0A0E0HTR3_ORYNI